MKHIVILCDGMSDFPIKSLGGKTPMEAAKKPNMDKLAAKSELGMVKTVADNLKPGSDVANLSVLGYDPAVYYSGRSPLEAASIGIDMKPSDLSLRCNLVTLSDEENYTDKTMLDYCADDISTRDAAVLIDFIKKELSAAEFKFYSGISYRHCLIWDNGITEFDKLGELVPPHDITNKKIKSYLKENKSNAVLFDMIKKSYPLLSSHPLNKERIKRGKRPANSIWLWGEGYRKELMPFREKYGLKGAMISAVDLLKGIGKFAEMDVINVKGATGYLDTNFTGKADAAINALKNGADFVYIHIEAPDECGHRNELEGKIKAIELIDELVLGRILSAFQNEEIKILICPDHPTPLELGTHTNDPVPFLIYDSTKQAAGSNVFTEKTADKSGNYISDGHMMMDKFLKELS